MAPPLAAMPPIGLGTWKAAPGEVGAAVRSALRLGYRHIDCAAIYGNETEIGATLRSALEQVRPALERTLADLRLQYLDLYLIHWPVVHRHGVLMPSVADDQIPLEQLPLHLTWAAMEELVDAGLVRRIGVSNCSAAKLAALLPHCRHRPAVNQVERHPWLQQAELLAFCRTEGIAVTAYAPLGSPASGGPAPLLNDPVINAIAAAHGAGAAQVLIAWGIACGTSVIPKSVRSERQAANLQAASELQLSPAEMEEIAGLDRHHRFVNGSFWELPGGPYSRASLWDEPATS